MNLNIYTDYTPKYDIMVCILINFLLYENVIYLQPIFKSKRYQQYYLTIRMLKLNI